MNINRFESCQINMKNKIIGFIKNYNGLFILILIITITVYNIKHIVLINLNIVYYLTSFNSLYLAIFVGLEFSIYLLVLVSWIIFIILYSNRQFLIKDLFKRFNSLPFLNKIMLVNFTLFVSIPNRVYIHNHSSNSFTFCIVSYFILLCYLSPIIIFPLIIYFTIIIESIVFGTFYETSEKFANLICKRFFNNDIIFSKIYIREFWGNASSSGFQRLKGSILTATIWTLTGMYGRSEYKAEKLEVENYRSLYLQEKVQLWRVNNDDKITNEELKNFSGEARKEAFDEHAGWVLQTIDKLEQIKTEIFEKKKKESLSREQLEEITALEATMKSATAEVERYNRTSIDQVDENAVRQNIIQNNEEMADLQKLIATKEAFKERYEEIEKSDNFSNDEKQNLLHIYKTVEDNCTNSITDFVNAVKMNREVNPNDNDGTGPEES